MATTNVIRTLTIRSTVEGADKTKADLKGIQSAHEGVARVSDTSAKGQLSLADAVAKAERRFNTSIRAQQDFEKVQRQMNLAVAQNPALQARANSVIQLATTHFDQASKGQRVFSTAMQAANDNMRSLAVSAGPLGAVLSTLGPGGIVAAAGIGAAAVALHQMLSAAINLAERAGKLKDFAETTGFTVIELQALEKAGAQVGVSAESVSKGLERFSVQMAEVKLQTGETFEKLLAINPELAKQVATAGSLTKAYELVSKAIKDADLERANQLARAFFGRGGVEQTRLMRVVGDAAGLKGVIADLNKTDAITAQQADRWDTLGDKIAENMKAAKQNIASIFTEDVLNAAEKFSKSFLDFTRSVKEFGINEDLRTFIDFMSNKAVQGALAGGLAGAMAGGPVGAAIGAVSGAVAGGAVQLHDVEKIRETTEELKKQESALARANEKLEHYRKLSVAPDNHWAKADVERAAELERVVVRITARVQALRGDLKGAPTFVGTVTPGGTQDAGAEAAKKAAEEQERLRVATIASYNAMALWMSIIGSAATMAERYELATRKLAAAKVDGKITEEQHTRAIAEQKQQLELRLGVADMQKVTEGQLAQVREVTANAGLSAEQQRLAVQIAIVDAKERERNAWRRANPEMAQALDYAESLAKALVAVAMGTGTVSDAFKSLAGTLASDSIRSLFKGDLMAAGLQAIGAAVMSIAGSIFDDSDAKALDAAKKSWAGMKDEMNEFIRASDGLDLSRQAQAVHQLRKSYDDLWVAAMKAGDTANADRVAWAFVHGIWNQMDNFANQIGGTKSDIVTQMDDLRRGAAQLIQAMQDVNFYSAEAGATIQHDLNAQLAILRERAQKSLIADINEAEGKGFVNELNSLFDRVTQLKTEANVTGVDTTLIDRFLQVQAQKIVDGADLAGTAFDGLIGMFPSLTGLVHESTSALEEQAEAQKQLQQELDSAARSIVDYVASFRTGTESTLSPQARLALAQSNYNSQFALAQSGNLEAQKSITQYADPLIKAIKENFASGGSTQIEAILSQLLTLPALVQSSDPVVQALLDVQQRINVTNASLVSGGQTAAQLLSTSVVRLDTSIAKLVDVITNLSSVVTALASSNSWLSSMNNLSALMNQQLAGTQTFVGGQIGGAVGGKTYDSQTGGEGPGQLGGTVNNTLLLALNKIVYNTAVIAENTALTAARVGAPTNGQLGFGGTYGGRFAAGGTAPPFSSFIYGEHHPQGPFFARAGSQPIPITPSMPAFGGVSNDNSRVEAKLDQLIGVLSAVGAAMVNAETMTGKEVRDAVVGAISKQTDTIKAEARQNRNNPKAA